MSVYVTTYVYAADSAARRDELRPGHRAWLAEQPGLLVSGPTAGGPTDGAVLVFEGSSAAEVDRLLDDDPFATAGDVIAERTTVEWTVVAGRLRGAFPGA